MTLNLFGCRPVRRALPEPEPFVRGGECAAQTEQNAGDRNAESAGRRD